MRLDRHRRSRILVFLGTLWDEQTRRTLLILLYTGVVFACGALACAYTFHRLGITPKDVKRDLRLVMSSWPQKVRATFSNPNVERITIDIKHKHYSKLASRRAAALERGHLEVDDDDYVPATLRSGDAVLRARVRLKGDWIDHLETEKWSLRIKLRGDETLFGMKRFSIQHPKTRNYIYEWIYQRGLRREDVLGLRYEFIEVTLNGADLGIYALEEHFEKRLPEYNRRPAGPIVRFDENLMFRLQIQHRPFHAVTRPGHVEHTATSNTLEPYLAAEIDTFETGQMLADPVRSGQHNEAIHLLEAFRRGELETSQVFDVQKLATFFAISDLLGSRHSSQWRNIRFYYNPIASRLEPIGFDGDAGAIRHLCFVINTDNEESAPLGERREPFIRALFSDLVFFEEYIRELERVSQKSYLDQLLADLKEELDEKLNLLHSEFLTFDFSTDVFYRNRKYLETALNPAKAVHAYYSGSSGNELDLQLGNIHSMPVEAPT
jgi:hypothetical protein